MPEQIVNALMAQGVPEDVALAEAYGPPPEQFIGPPAAPPPPPPQNPSSDPAAIADLIMTTIQSMSGMLVGQLAFGGGAAAAPPPPLDQAPPGLISGASAGPAPMGAAPMGGGLDLDGDGIPDDLPIGDDASGGFIEGALSSVPQGF